MRRCRKSLCGSKAASFRWCYIGRAGDHTALQLKMNRTGKHRWTVPEDTLSLIRELARLMPDHRLRGSSIAPASRPGAAMAGPRRAYARSAATTALPSIVKASGLSGAR